MDNVTDLNQAYMCSSNMFSDHFLNKWHDTAKCTCIFHMYGTFLITTYFNSALHPAGVAKLSTSLNWM